MKLPRQPVPRFFEIFDALRRDKVCRWESADVLRYCALTTLTHERSPEELAGQVVKVADEIKSISGWFGELNSSIRFLIASLAVQNGDNANDLMSEMDAGKKLFGQLKMSKGGMYGMMAILILRYSNKKEGKFSRLQLGDFERLQQIHKEMSGHHWWLTGIDDYPACAVLHSQSESPEMMCQQIEQIYQQLNAAGFWRGNPLQAAANLLYLSHEHPTTIATRFHELYETFRSERVRIWQSEYDELAVLTFIDSPAESIVANVLQIRDELRIPKPRMGKSTAFNIASSICFLQNIKNRKVSNAKALIDLNAILTAQQAAVASAAIAASVAASSSASG